MTRTYSRQEADEILRRALAERTSDGISHDDLVAAAREVGISSAAIEAAVLELGEDRRVNERALDIRRRKRSAFVRHFFIFLVINAGIFFVDQSDGGAWFFHYVLVVWGTLLAVLGVGQLAPDREALRRRAERELEREERRAAKRRRQEKRAQGQPAATGVQEFERAVQEGVSAALAMAARVIRGVTPEVERYRVQEPQRHGGSAAAREPAEREPREREPVEREPLEKTARGSQRS